MPTNALFGGGGGSGVGIALGPRQNTFGDGSTASRNAAIALRNTYAAANPAWLADYNSDRSFYILLAWRNNARVYQRRNVSGTSWEDVTTLAPGTPGRDGTDGRGITSVANDPGDGASAIITFSDGSMSEIDLPEATLAAVLAAINALSLPEAGEEKLVQLTDTGAALIDVPEAGGQPVNLSAVLSAINMLANLPAGQDAKIIRLRSSGADLIDIPSGGEQPEDPGVNLRAVLSAANQLAALPGAGQTRIIQFTAAGAAFVDLPSGPDTYLAAASVNANQTRLSITDNAAMQTVYDPVDTRDTATGNYLASKATGVRNKLARAIKNNSSGFETADNGKVIGVTDGGLAVVDPPSGGQAPTTYAVSYGLATTAGVPVGQALTADLPATFDLAMPATTSAGPTWYFQLEAGRTVSGIWNTVVGRVPNTSDWTRVPGTQRWRFTGGAVTAGRATHIQVATTAG